MHLVFRIINLVFRNNDPVFRFINLVFRNKDPFCRVIILPFRIINQLSAVSRAEIGEKSTVELTNNFLRFSIMFWVCFPPPYLNRAGDRLRRSYKQATIGELSRALEKKLGSKSSLQNRNTKQTK